MSIYRAVVYKLDIYKLVDYRPITKNQVLIFSSICLYLLCDKLYITFYLYCNKLFLLFFMLMYWRSSFAFNQMLYSNV